MTDERYAWVGSDYSANVSTQSYGDSLSIDGVQTLDLTLFGDEGGDFCEITRFLGTGALALLPNYRPAQLSYSSLEPGTVKAWHLHQHQTDLWFVPPRDRLLVGLLDVRESSATYRRSSRFILGGGKARLLAIPPGVAHGVANLTHHPATLLYFTDRAFDRDDPDEHRLPHDLLGEDFWTILPA